MSNSSDTLTEAAKGQVVNHTIYIGQGLLNVVLNALILVTILRHSALRTAKEYVALGAAATADGMNCLGTVCAGLYRIPLYLNGTHQSAASGRFCLLKAHILLWSVFWCGSYAMQVVLSLDRVLSVAIPLRYLLFTRRYMLTCVSIAFGACFVQGASAYIANWSATQPIHTKICWAWHAFGWQRNYIMSTACTMCALLSIGLYCSIPILYWHRERAVVPNEGGQTREAAARVRYQKQLNKSISLSCVFTFLLVALPNIVLSVSRIVLSVEADQWISVWMYIAANFDSTFNLFIYYKKQVYFRKGFKALFQNKTMPTNLLAWNQIKNK